MSLVDDQIFKENKYNALDELARRINNRTKSKEPLGAAQVVADFEADIERARIKETPYVEGKTVIDPEAIVEQIKEDRGQKEDDEMSR